MVETRTIVEHCVEGLCSHGCERVSVYIRRLRAGEVFSEVEALDQAMRQQVLEELELIMAPYADGGDPD